jgi:hypothetical protein
MNHSVALDGRITLHLVAHNAVPDGRIDCIQQEPVGESALGCGNVLFFGHSTALTTFDPRHVSSGKTFGVAGPILGIGSPYETME